MTRIYTVPISKQSIWSLKFTVSVKGALKCTLNVGGSDGGLTFDPV